MEVTLIPWTGNPPPHKWQWQTNNSPHPVQSEEKTDGLQKKSFSHNKPRKDAFDMEAVDIL